MPNLILIFTTGLLTGGLSCLAVQGGLLATTIAQRQAFSGPSRRDGVFAVALFLLAKLFAYTLLGIALGWAGSVLQLSLTTKALLQIGVAVFMIGTALGLMDVHPFFRHFILQPPKFLGRIVRNQSKSADVFGPLVLGLMTVFIPCGTTQAMMALAVGSGNPVYGGLIMFAFVLGTSPLFLVFGFLAQAFKEVFSRWFRPVAAATIMLVAIFSFYSGLGLLGFGFDSAIKQVYCTISICQDSNLVAVQGANTNAGAVSNEITVKFGETGYTLDHNTIAAGQAVTMRLVNASGRGCIQAFTIPSLGVQKIVRVGTSEVVKFTAPSTPGELTIMCSMGMYRAKLKVV